MKAKRIVQHCTGIRNFFFTGAIIVVLSFFYSDIGLYGQSPDNSGIIHTTATGEETNLILVKIDVSVSIDDAGKLLNEFGKYKEIIKVDPDLGNGYVYFKYTDNISPNQILAVLDKINMRGHYLAGTTPVYYIKDENIYFIP